MSAIPSCIEIAIAIEIRRAEIPRDSYDPHVAVGKPEIHHVDLIEVTPQPSPPGADM